MVASRSAEPRAPTTTGSASFSEIASAKPAAEPTGEKKGDRRREVRQARRDEARGPTRPIRRPDRATCSCASAPQVVNPVDSYIHTGTHARKPALPYTPGFDGAGEVERVGAEVKGFAPGERVYIGGPGYAPGGVGTYAERALCPPAHLHALPARSSFAQGAAIGVPYATAYRALFQRATTRPGETVLVHGATGGVGIATVELAHARGLRVIGSGGTDAGSPPSARHGADVVVNHRTPGYTDEIMQATGGRGVDVIVEMAAHVNLDRDLTLLAKAAASSSSATAAASRSTRARRWAAMPRSSA
jgi:NADPH:quinone reductase-like Zn-dependent oxidoreductase